MPTPIVLFLSAYVGGLAAVIIALQVWGGFPPFYHKLDAITRKDEFSKLHKQLAWLFPALLAPWLAGEFAPPLIVASAFLSLGIYAWVIWQIRKLVATRQPTTMNYLVLALEQRWPLALFDIWTWGLTALFLALAFGPALF